jgi:hypothetical protein
MQLLTSERTEYYLNTSLDVLHRESIEWLNELEFWMDEIIFFYKLIQDNTHEYLFPAAEIAEAQKQLIEIHSDKLEKLRKELVRHERVLGNILRSTSTDDQDYRIAHNELFTKLIILQKDIREFKQKVFRLVLR